MQYWMCSMHFCFIHLERWREESVEERINARIAVGENVGTNLGINLEMMLMKWIVQYKYRILRILGIWRGMASCPLFAQSLKWIRVPLLSNWSRTIDYSVQVLQKPKRKYPRSKLNSYWSQNYSRCRLRSNWLKKYTFKMQEKVNRVRFFINAVRFQKRS